VKKLLLLLSSLIFATGVFAEEAPISDVNATPEAQSTTISAPNDASPAPENNTDATKPVAEDETPAKTITQDMKAFSKTEVEENPDLHMKIKVVYPQIQGENLTPAAEQFNKLVSDKVHFEVDQFKKYVAEDAIHMKSLPPEAIKNTFDMNYNLDVVKADKTIIVSLRLAIEGYQAGRAHPYHTHEVLSFNMTTGKEIKFNELFKANSHYLNVIAKYCKTYLNKNLEDKTFIDEGTKPEAKNFRNWNIEENGLKITFDEYQVAPYVFGPQEVEIPYSELKKVFSPKAPIYPCAMNSKLCKKQ
jgi:hypothetical protein